MMVLNISSVTISMAIAAVIFDRRAQISLTTCRRILPRGGSSNPTVVYISEIWTGGKRRKSKGKGGDHRGKRISKGKREIIRGR